MQLVINIFGKSGADLLDLEKWATLITSNEELNHNMKIVKWLEEFGLLIEDVSKTTENEAKQQKGGLRHFRC